MGTEFEKLSKELPDFRHPFTPDYGYQKSNLRSYVCLGTNWCGFRTQLEALRNLSSSYAPSMRAFLQTTYAFVRNQHSPVVMLHQTLIKEPLNGMSQTKPKVLVRCATSPFITHKFITEEIITPYLELEKNLRNLF